MYRVRILKRRYRDALDGIEQMLADGEFRGCVGAVDCMKLKWNNFPAGIEGQFQSIRDRKWRWYISSPGANTACSCGIGFQVHGGQISIRPWCRFILHLGILLLRCSNGYSQGHTKHSFGNCSRYTVHFRWRYFPELTNFWQTSTPSR